MEMEKKCKDERAGLEERLNSVDKKVNDFSSGLLLEITKIKQEITEIKGIYSCKMNTHDLMDPNDIAQRANPSASHEQKKDQPDCSFGGSGYRVKLMFLYLHRTLTSRRNLELGAEWPEEIVSLFKDDANAGKSELFLRAKHKLNEKNKISYEELINEENGDFSLKKYFISYMKMKENSELKNEEKIDYLPIFTNIDFDQQTVKSKNMLIKIESSNSILHFDNKFENKNPTRYHLIPNDEIKKILGESSKAHQLAEELVHHVFNKKQLTLKTPIFKEFHKALCAHVIDKSTNKFRDNFVKGENLSAQEQNFRSIFYELISRHKNVKNKNYDKNNLMRENLILNEDFLRYEETGNCDMPHDVISEDDISEFFELLVFAVDQPNEMELGQVIEQEVSSSFNLSRSKDIVEQILSDLTDWPKKKMGEFITEETGKGIFDKARNIMNNRFGMGLCANYKAKLKTHNEVIQFEESSKINAFLNDDKSYIMNSNSPLLTIIKIYQCVTEHAMYKADDTHMFIDFDTVLDNEQQNCILSALNANQLLLVIHCDCAGKQLNEKSEAVQSFFQKLNEVLNNRNKKILLVVRNEVNLRTDIINGFSVENNELNFKDLSFYSQTLLLKKLVKFQGNSIQLEELIKDKSEWNDILDGEIIEELITNEQLEIGSAPLRLSQSEAAYAKRYKEIKPENLLNALKLDTQNPETDMFLITDNTKHLTTEKYFDRFIQLLNINDEKHKIQFKKCAGILDNLDIYFTKCKKINMVIKEKEDINLEIFKKICYYNSDKFVYWLEIVNDEFFWLQVYDPHFYINRHFLTQKPIKLENLPDLITENKCVIVKNDFNENIFEPIKKRKGRAQNKQNVFFCESESEAKKTFHELCLEFKPSSVHLIKEKENIWSRSYIDCQLVSEEELANAGGRVVVLEAEPGMGKTTTLTRLSEHKLRDNWVIRFNLRNHQNEFNNFINYHIKPHEAIEDIMKFPLGASQEKKTNRMTTKLLKHSLNHKMSKPLLIIFVVDEFSYDYRTKLIYMIKYLKENTFANLWISSRNEHSYLNLEGALGVHLTTFKELLSDERDIYLKNFYQVRLKLQLDESESEAVFRRENGHFDVFFNALLEKVDTIFEKTLSRFMGIPLQLRLLAEGFLPEFEEYIMTNSSNKKEPKFKNLNVLHLLERFINVKYDIYFKEKTKLAIEMSPESKRWLTDALNEMHQRVALKLLFPNRVKSLTSGVKAPFKNEQCEMDSEQEKELMRVGILHFDPFEQRLEFTHGTFGEYFIAQFILHNFRENLHCQLFEALKSLLMDIISEPYEMICMFLNEQITVKDLSQVKFNGHFDTKFGEKFNTIKFNQIDNISKDYPKLTEFTLTFFKNKIWILNQLDFWDVLTIYQNGHCLKYSLRLMINHYDVVHAGLVRDPFACKIPILRGAGSEHRAQQVRMIMSAIKCYPKIIEEATRDYDTDDLCEIFTDDEELCQLVRKLKDAQSDMTSYEMEANKLLESFIDCDYDKETTSTLKYITWHSKYFENNRFGKLPHKITRGRDLENLVNELDEMLNSEDEEKNRSTFPEGFIGPYEELNQILNQLKSEARNTFYEMENVFDIMNSAIESIKKKVYEEAKHKLKSLSHLPVASLWFDTYYNPLFRQLLARAIKDEQETFVLFLFEWLNSHPIISMHLFTIVFVAYPQYTKKMIECVECKEMKLVLLQLFVTLENSLSDDEIKEFAKNLLNAIEEENDEEVREVLKSVESSDSDKIVRWIKEFESEKVLKDLLELLIKYGQLAICELHPNKDHLNLQQMMKCLKHFPRILHFLLLRYTSDECIHSEYNKQSLCFIFDVVCFKFPQTAAVFLAILVDEELRSPLYFSLKNNSTEVIRLVFNTLLPYPNILKSLILTPSPLYKTHLHQAILSSETKTMEMFLSQLSRDSQVRKHVFRHFLTDEEDKCKLYQQVEVTTTNSLLTFLNHLKIIDQNLFKKFFLPVAKSVKPAFYLAGERGLKRVMDVLLRALKSEEQLLWELLTWTHPVSGKTVLHRAAERGYTQIVDAILSSVRKQKHKSSLAFIKDHSGHTPLDCAILSERQIIRNDFNIELRRKLIECDDYKSLKCFIKYGFVDTDDDESEDEIEIADFDITECLCKLSPSLKNMPMVVNLILVLAKSFNDVESMLAMFENEDLSSALASMNVSRDEYSYNLYYSAIERNSFELVNELIEKGYDVNCSNGYGYTPLMKAVKRSVAGNTRDTNIMKVLMQNGADIYFNNMNGECAHSMAWDADIDRNYIEYILRDYY